MHQVMALIAVPFKAVFHSLRTRNFNYQSDRSRRMALRRMTRMLWQQKNFALLDGNLDRRFARRFHHANKNIALQLVEKFLGGIVVIVHTLVGSADDRHDNLAIVPYLGVSHRRFQFVAIGVNPILKAEGFQRLYGWHYFFPSLAASGLYAIAFISISRCG